MSSAPAPARIARLPDSRRADQRSHTRYPIGLDVDYKLFSKGRVARHGSGRTIDVSSSGVCFESEDSLPAEGLVELVMNWPFLLEGVCPLALVMRGRIVRNDGRRVAVQAKHHEFRTAGARASRGRSLLK